MSNNDNIKKKKAAKPAEKQVQFNEQKPGDSNKAGAIDNSIRAKEEKESMKNSK